MTHAARVGLCIGLSTLVLATAARADNASLAEVLFREGRQAMRSGDYATALAKLAESQRLDPSAGTRLNLALCEEHEHQLAAAWAGYRAVLDEVPASDERSAIARSHAEAVEPRLPHVRVSRAPGASVTILLDGVVLGPASLAVPLPVDPGTHAVDAREPDGDV